MREGPGAERGAGNAATNSASGAVRVTASCVAAQQLLSQVVNEWEVDDDELEGGGSESRQPRGARRDSDGPGSP